MDVRPTPAYETHTTNNKITVDGKTLRRLYILTKTLPMRVRIDAVFIKIQYCAK